MQRRLHPRVRLRLPVRIRWSAPLGQQTQQCRTINVSRGGLLLQSSQPMRPGHPLWVAFPFDPENAAALPESIARVARCMKSEGAHTGYWDLAVQFEGIPARPAQSSVLSGGKAAPSENANGHGRDMALPIRVRPKAIPWHEDAMTIDVSRDKLKFQTNREYQFGERLMVSFAAPGEGPWSGDGESETEVIGIETSAGSDFLQVTVRRKSR